MFEDSVKRRNTVAYRESSCVRSRLVSVASERPNKEKKKLSGLEVHWAQERLFTS